MLQSSDHSPTEPDPNRPDQPVMATEREEFPAHFTFSQRYGYEPLSEPMQGSELAVRIQTDKHASPSLESDGY